MPNKSEKERRKHILSELDKRAAEEFENSLPLSRERFKRLFDYLDVELTRKGCDETNHLTKSFLHQIGAANTGEVLGWLADKGGYCDCEILANVEEQFE